MAKKNNNHYKMKNKPKKKSGTFGKVMAYTLLPITIASASMAGGYYLSKNNIEPTTGNVSTQIPTQNANDQKILQLTEDLKESANKISLLNTQIEELKADSEATATAYAEEIATLEAQIEQLEKDNEATINQYNEQIAELDEQIEQLKADSEATATDHAKEISELETQKQELQNTINSLNATHAQEITSLQSQIDELQSTNTANAEQIATLEAQVAEETAKFEEKKTELENLQASYNELQISYDSAVSERDSLAGDYGALYQEHTDLENQYSQLESDYQMAQIDRDYMSNEYNILYQNHSDLQSQYGELENEHTELENNYNELQTSYDSAVSERDSLAGEYGALNDQYNNLQSEYDNLNNEYSSLLNEFAISQLDSQTLMGLYDGSIKELTIPDNVTTIRPYAFYGLTLDNLILPSTLTTLSDNALTGLTLNNALNISVDGNLSIGASAFAKGQVEAKKNDLTLSVPNGALTFTGPATFDFDGAININAKTINGHSTSSYSACFNCDTLNITAETYNHESNSGLNFNAVTESTIKFTKDVELDFPINIYSGAFTMEITPTYNVDMENSINVVSTCPKLTIINSTKLYRAIYVNDGADFINNGTIECLDLQGTFQFNSDAICGENAVINELRIHNYAVYFTGVTISTSNIKSIIFDGSSYKNDLYKLINSNTTSLYVTDALYDQYIADTNYSAHTGLIHKLSELNDNGDNGDNGDDGEYLGPF